LQRKNEILGARLNTIHNLYYYQDLMAGMREAIEQGVFAEFKQWFFSSPLSKAMRAFAITWRLSSVRRLLSVNFSHFNLLL
jgi:queuine/archaeosine tRNA-ribosyltransferase